MNPFHINIKQKAGCFLLCLSSLSFMCCSAFAGKKTRKNEFGLAVLKEKSLYLQNIKTNPLHKMIRVEDIISPLNCHFYYAGLNNFTGEILYENPRLYLTKAAILKLMKAREVLLEKGYDFIFFDGYRPYSVTEKMWKIVPDDRYAANPANGSGHNRGVAVDLSLVVAQTGVPLAMPTGYDNFSDTAHQDFTALPDSVIINRKILRDAMVEAGFIALPTEWWHFSLPNSKVFPLLDFSFKQMDKITRK